MGGFTVGVVIPTYNRPKETLVAVASALEQSLPPDQVVVVDDGSFPENLDRLRNSLSRLQVDVHATGHTGHPGHARNTGVSMLATSHVAFLDSDDVWHSKKLEEQVCLIKKGARAVSQGTR